MIHQIWVGGNIPQRFIDRSLNIEAINPGYTLIRWDEDKLLDEFPEIKIFLDLECVPSFISDWARFRILTKYGGWYIDYDVEGIKPLDDLNINPELLAVAEFEYPGYLGASGFFMYLKG